MADIEKVTQKGLVPIELIDDLRQIIGCCSFTRSSNCQL